jgi:hypothetical protein
MGRKERLERERERERDKIYIKLGMFIISHYAMIVKMK